MRRSTAFTLCLCVAAAAASGGCTTATMAAFGLSAHLYKTNTTLEVVFDHTYREVVSAAPGAFEELSIALQSREIDLLEGEVEGTTETGETVTVKAVREEGHNSTVRIRVGVLGDESMNWAIYTALKRQLAVTGRVRLEHHKLTAAQ